jgi:thioredoxin reductase (NADPH)
VNTPDIENYPGLAHVSGFDFATGLYNQAIDLGAKFRYERVLGVREENGEKIVETKKREFHCKAVIIATGAKNRPLGIDREEELTGNGVSYCATCDGSFFKGQTVAVNGGGNTAIEDAEYLADLCEKVYVIHRRDEFRADEADVLRLKKRENVEFVLNSTVTGLIGEGKLNAVEVTDKNTGEKKTLEVTGLFVAIGQVPDNRAFENLVDLAPAGYVEAGETIENAVRREIFEETGIKVRNIQYRGSQSWPFPQQLMLAFYADYESGEIKVQEEEIEDARWFDRNNLPATPAPGSIAYKLIHGEI